MLLYENTEIEVKEGDIIEVDTIEDGLIETVVMLGSYEVSTDNYGFTSIYGLHCGGDEYGTGLRFFDISGNENTFATAKFLSRTE